MSTVPFGTVSRLIGCSPYHAHDSTLGQRVVEDDRDIRVLRLVARHVLLELFHAVGNDREVLGGNAVTLRTVAVSAERDAPATGLAGREHDAAADSRGQVLLKDPAVDNFDDQR
jgi:hypothetical protein